MGKKKVAEVAKEPVYLIGKQDKAELYELFMVAVGQQIMGEALTGAIHAVVQQGQATYRKKLNEVKERLSIPAEKELFVNFQTGAGTVRDPEPKPEVADESADA